MATREILISEIELLLAKTRECQQSTTAHFFETLAFIKQSYYLAPYNALLVMQQRPDATFVLSVGQWQKRFGRVLRQGVQPIVIKKTFGPVEFVYDIKDIDGIDEIPIGKYDPNLPTEENCRALFPMEGDVRGAKGLFSELLRVSRKDGLRIVESPLDMSHAGQVELVEKRFRRTQKEVKEQGRLINYLMTLNSVHPIDLRCATTVHELAHIFCSHLNEFDQPGFVRKKQHEEEFEAEAVAYLYCYRHDFRPKSEKYLAEYLTEGREPSLESFDIILSALKKIEDLLKPEEIAAPPQQFKFSFVDREEWMACTVELHGDSLQYELEGPYNKPQRNGSIVPTLSAWKRFWQACHMAGLWSWKRAYLAKSESAGTEWKLVVALNDREVVVNGKNAYPEGGTGQGAMLYGLPLNHFMEALSKLLGGLPLF